MADSAAERCLAAVRAKGVRVRRLAGAFAATLAIGLSHAASAQDAEPEPTAEEMIEVAREAYRPPGVRRRCLPGEAGEIVVCAPDPDAYRVESPTDEAIRSDQPASSGVPRAPGVFGIPPCKSYAVCVKGGWVPRQVHLIDLSKIPTPLTEEEAAMVLRAEDSPPPEP